MASPSAWASIAWPCLSTASTTCRFSFRTMCASCASSYETLRTICEAQSAALGGFTSHQSRVTSHDMTFADAKNRFSNRAADYVRYRPGYPASLLDLLGAACSLPSGHVIADVRSGT